MFKDTKEGTTHYQDDGCGEPKHNNPKLNQKKIVKKAWAVLNEKNKIIAVELTSSRPKRFTIGTWLFFTDNSNCVPVEISYSIPIKAKKK